MLWARWVLVPVAVIDAGWLVLDGISVLSTGQHLAWATPFADLLSLLGLEPASSSIGALLVLVGLAFWGLLGAHLVGKGWAWTGLLVLALGTTLHLPVGTVLGLLIIPLLAADKAQTTRYG